MTSRSCWIHWSYRRSSPSRNTNLELLERLTEEFIASGFDVRALM